MSGTYDDSMIDVSSDSFWEVRCIKSFLCSTVCNLVIYTLKKKKKMAQVKQMIEDQL